MMPNVVRGDRTAGLLNYLVGPGRANEHENPHLVAGDPVLMAWHDDAELGRDGAFAIARHLEKPRQAFGVDVAGGHVWHCSLSLRSEEGQLTDETWQQIATDFVTAMGFDDHEGTKAPCRWVAVRHGLSKNGNDHIHIVVNLVREDGTKASIHHDFRRAQTVSRELEERYGLERLESARAERGTRGYKQGERESEARRRAQARHERDHREGRVEAGWAALSKEDRADLIHRAMREEQPREALARRVRACATAAESEGEFVRRLRGAGVLVRPRFADGRNDVVTGYSVAAKPVSGERPIWYGGGHLGRDLTLPRLRSDWPDTPTGASEAAAEWVAARRGRRVVAPGRERATPTAEEWSRRGDELTALVERLRSVPLDDRSTWATVARQSSGLLAAWSTATETTPGPLARASEVLSRSAQTYRPTVPARVAGTTALSGAAMLVASAARGGTGATAQAVLIRQLLRLAQALHAAARAAEQHRLAAAIASDTRLRLEAVRDALPALALPSPRPALNADRPAPTPTLRLPQALEPRPRAAAPATPTSAPRGQER